MDPNDNGRRAKPTTAHRRITVAVVTPPAELDLLDTILATGVYDVMVIESVDFAYSAIKESQPQLVVMCVDIDQPSGCSVMSMLVLDTQTSRIPILTCLGSFHRSSVDLDIREPARLDRRRSQCLLLN